VYISIDQLGYPRASIREVVQLASTFNRDAALRIIGMYNLAVSLAATKFEGRQDERLKVQTALLRNSISARRLREMQGRFFNAHLLKQPIFHRQQLLTMLKLVAKFGRSTGGNALERRDDFDAIAELALQTNSLLPNTFDDGDPGDQIAPTLAVGLELENPQNIADPMLRAASLRSDLERVAGEFPFARHVESAFLFATGLNFEELLDVTFAVWSYYHVLTIDELIADQRLAHFNPLNVRNVISAKHLHAALDRYAVPFHEIPGLRFGNADSRAFVHDHSALRERPIWKIAEDNYFCVDPAFLQERLTSGIYWTVLKALDHDDGVNFARCWGKVFETRLWKTLESIFPRDRVWRSPRYRDKNEAWDAAIDYGQTVIVIQSKAGFLPASGKYSGEREPFFQSLEPTFGYAAHAAAKQVCDNLTATFGVTDRRGIPAFGGRQFAEVIPLVLYLEPILKFGLTTRPLAKRFDQWLRQTLFRLGTTVRPLVYMHIDDFNLVAQYLRDGDLSLIEILHEKYQRDRDHVSSFDQFWLENMRPGMRFPVKGNAVTTAEWKTYGEEALGRLRRGDYHPPVETQD
jgi:hypothetical protein